MWSADKLVYRGEDNFIRAYQGSDLVWERPVNNIIYYTTTDNQIIDISSHYYWGDDTNIIQNTYTDVGVIVFSKDIDTIPSGYDVFRGNTRLLTITLPRSIDYIQSYAFAGCTSLREIEIPAKVDNNLGDYCFYQCVNLVNVRINVGVTKLGLSVFRECTSLVSIEIPDTVRVMSDACFYKCTSLVEVIMHPTSPPVTLSTNNFNYNAPGRKIKVPASSVNEYKAATGWSDYASDIISQ